MARKIELETGGTVWKLMVSEGQAVAAGDTLFIMEVMKMESAYEAPCAGKVRGVSIAEGDVLKTGHVAMEIA